MIEKYLSILAASIAMTVCAAPEVRHKRPPLGIDVFCYGGDLQILYCVGVAEDIRGADLTPELRPLFEEGYCTAARLLADAPLDSRVALALHRNEQGFRATECMAVGPKGGSWIYFAGNEPIVLSITFKQNP